MTFLDLIQKYLSLFNNFVQKIASFIAGTLIGVMTLVILYMVYFRYVLNDTPYWSEEVARCMMLWMTFCVLPISYRIGGNVSINILLNKFKGRFKYAFQTLTKSDGSSFSSRSFRNVSFGSKAEIIISA